MWRNYLTVGLRALAKNKTYAFINIFGLALGLAACLMILLYVRYELSYDKWLPNAENVYQLQTYYHDKQTGEDLQPANGRLRRRNGAEEGFPAGREDGLRDRRRLHRASANGEAIAVENGSHGRRPLLRRRAAAARQGRSGDGAAARSARWRCPRRRRRKLFGAENPIGQTLTVMHARQGRRPPGHRRCSRTCPRTRTCNGTCSSRYDPVSCNRRAARFPHPMGLAVGLVLCGAEAGHRRRARSTPQLPAWEKRNIADEDFGDRKYNAGDEQD